MRVATVVPVVLSVVALWTISLPATAAPAGPASQPARLLVTLDEHDGSVAWRVKPRGPDGGFLTVRTATHGVVIADELRCLSAARPYEPGDASVVGFDARTGAERWRIPDARVSLGMFGPIAPPDAGVATLPVASAVDGAPRLVDALSGAERGPLAGVPVAASGDLLFVVALDAFSAAASTRGIVTAIDRRTGAARWTKNLGANLFSIDADGTAVAVAAGPIPDPGTELGQLGGVEVLDPATGQRRWAAALMPAYGIDIASDQVVFQNLDRLRAVDAGTGQLAWDVPVQGLLDTTPTANGTLVAVRGSGSTGPDDALLVSAFDSRSGARRWAHSTTSELLNPGVANDRAVTVATRRRIVAYDHVRGRPRWARRTPPRAAAVVAVANRVYISGGCTVSND
jgi:outer membrane protein assembly factor BamB